MKALLNQQWIPNWLLSVRSYVPSRCIVWILLSIVPYNTFKNYQIASHIILVKINLPAYATETSSSTFVTWLLLSWTPEGDCTLVTYYSANSWRRLHACDFFLTQLTPEGDCTLVTSLLLSWPLKETAGLWLLYYSANPWRRMYLW